MTTRTKGAKGSRGRTRLSIRYFDDQILLTDTHAWAYYRIPSVSYEFTTPEEREALATNITVALAAIRMQDAEVHLRIAHRSYPAHAWATGLDATSDGGPGWREYLEQTYQHVWAQTRTGAKTTPGSGSASAACGRSCRAACFPSSAACTPAARAGSAWATTRSPRRRSSSGRTRPSGWAGR